MAEPKRQRSFSALLAFAGLVLLALCVVTALRRQDVLAGGLAVLGLGAMVLAALTPRLTGPVEMGLTGFKMELVKLSEVGRLAGYSEEEILAAIEDKLRRDNDGHGEEEHNLRREPPPPQPRPRGRPGGGWSWSDDDDRRWNADNRRLWDQSEDIERRIEFLQQVVSETSRDSPTYDSLLKELADALRVRYQLSGHSTDQDQLLSLLTQLEDARRRRVS